MSVKIAASKFAPSALLLRYRGWARNNINIAALPVVMVVVSLLMIVVTGGRFISAANLSAMAFQIPELGLLSLAMMITMITGGINLSTISTTNFTSVIMAVMLTQLGAFEALSPALLIIATITAGLIFSLLLGLLNGLLVAYVGISPVLTTLSTMIFFEGLTLAITKGFVISGFPDQFLAIGSRTLLGIPYTFFIFIICAALMSVLYRRRPFGKHLYMVGSNETATRFSGVNTRRLLVKTYVISGLLCGIVAVIMTARFNSANARTGVSFLLLSVLISVLGGTDPFGGFGRILGLVLALFILQMLSSGLNLLGASSFVTVSLWGIILILVIAYRHVSSTRRIKDLIQKTMSIEK